MRAVEAARNRVNAALWKSSTGSMVLIKGGAGQRFHLESIDLFRGTASLTREQETKTVPASQLHALDNPPVAG